MTPRQETVYKWGLYALVTLLCCAVQGAVLQYVSVLGVFPFLYPILESQTFVPSSLTETFANFSLFYSILDCYCNNPNPSKDLDLIGWICNQGVPFQSFISKSYEAVIENRSFFLSLLRAVRVRFSALFHG